jgi:hypothetical protein
MHMRTMRYFAAEERENTARGDWFEGASVIYQPTSLPDASCTGIS